MGISGCYGGTVPLKKEIRPYFVGIFPYISYMGLRNRPYIW